MTTGEAIKRIKEHMDVHRIGWYPHIKLREALNMAIIALREQEERENPQPLTLDELRKMDAPVWRLCKQSNGDNGYWCICQKGTIITPAGFSYDVEETQNWVFLRSKPKEDV